MPSTRQNKVSRLLQKELASLFQQEARTWFEGAMITVTQVRITPDFSIARAYLSVFGPKDKEGMIEKIREMHPRIRGEVGKKIRNQLPSIPEFEFYLDDSLDYAERIDQLLKDD